MAPPRRPRRFSAAGGHADWLRLVEVSGPFLSLPVLARVFPQGLPRDDAVSDQRRRFRVALDGWEGGGAQDPGVHNAFVRFILSDILGWPDVLVKEGQALPPGVEATIAEHGETLRPDLVAVEPAGRPKAGRARVLVLVFPPDHELERAIEGRRWKASPATRAMELCHATEVPLAVVTNGAEWTLVHARRGETTTYATFSAPLFVEEPGLFDAFCALLGQQRLYGVADADTLEALLVESAANQQEVTDRLGVQVRRAVEVLVQAIDRADRNARGSVLRGVDERTLYEGAVAVMMRLVFLLAAEERKLLLLGDPLYDAHYAISTLLPQLEEVATKHGEEVLERRFAAWARLLATFRAVHGGVDHDRFRLPAYGGSLFDPDRFPFLEGRAPETRWRELPAAPVEVSDRTVYHLLRSLQLLEMAMPGGGREARRLSFRALDVEQIGHVYEGLLDHTAVRAREPVLGLEGANGREPELPLSAVVEAHDRGDGDLIALLEKETGRSAKTLRKLVEQASAADVEATTRLLQACGNDEKLRGVVKPYAQLLRLDSNGYPLVIHKGSVFVTAGADRRSTGTHYTPPSLTEPVVQYALEPQVYRGPAEGWPRETWQLRSPRELLALRVCDMAMGSGAFLAQACRWLGDRLVEAWEEAEANAGGKLVVTPEGDLATGAPGERPIPTNAHERVTLARRAVAERCLYGVDVNPMAVEIAKLSLWLVTLQKDRPFTFVDHALRCGDSLLGVTAPEQIASFHLDPEKGKALHQNLFAWTSVCEPALAAALAKRQKLESFTVESAGDAEEKERLLEEADAALADVRLVADAVVAAALATAERGEDAYAAELERLAPVVGAALDPKATPSSRTGAREQLASRVDALMNSGKPESAPRRRPFHWALEFPEVFGNGARERGMSAMCGNPPYLGGTKLEPVLGSDYRAEIVRSIAGGIRGVRGAADLCVYFLRRAMRLVHNESGSVGLVVTNSVSQGDSREVGLEQILKTDGAVYRAVSDANWPGEATVHYAQLCISRRQWRGTRVLDGHDVEHIDPGLSASGEAAPAELGANLGLAFEGAKLGGDGFVLNANEAHALVASEPEASRVVFRYLTGSELNSQPSLVPEQWVICFRDWPLSRKTAPAGYCGPVAEDFPKALEIVRARVKPGRERLPETTPWNRKLRSFWWHFGQFRWALEEAIKGMSSVLVVSRVGGHVAFARVPNEYVFSDRLSVFALTEASDLGVLQSSLHVAWAWRYGTTNLNLLSYSPSACFLTFPFPTAGALERAGVGQIAEEYSGVRMQCMLARNQGMTATYNEVNDAQTHDAHVSELRERHTALDLAVADAYGWGDLELGHGFHETKHGIRFGISETARREVLARLLKLNHERYVEEVKQGLHEKKNGKKGGRGNGPKGPPNGGGQGTLF